MPEVPVSLSWPKPVYFCIIGSHPKHVQACFHDWKKNEKKSHFSLFCHKFKLGVSKYFLTELRFWDSHPKLQLSSAWHSFSHRTQHIELTRLPMCLIHREHLGWLQSWTKRQKKTFIYVCFWCGSSSGGGAGHLLIGMLVVRFLAASFERNILYKTLNPICSHQSVNIG